MITDKEHDVLIDIYHAADDYLLALEIREFAGEYGGIETFLEKLKDS